MIRFFLTQFFRQTSHIGAPTDITPLKDDPVLANDPSRNNDFDYSSDSGQDRCPFAAHIRKGNPRSDLKYLGGTTLRRIWRQGIPFGPEVTEEEQRQARTLHRRGLLFAGYQSCIDNGFSFVQQGALVILVLLIGF
jgi:deferrochelatase/peroxidase EfeB